MAEKYSGFTDIGTGIQPFLYPVKEFPNHAILLPLKAMLFLLRSILLVIVGLLLIATNSISIILSFYSPLSFWWNRLFNFGLGRLVLFIIGFHWIQETEMCLKRSRSTPKKASSKDTWPAPAAAEDQAHIIKKKSRGTRLIVANHSSYIDILYLAFRHNPVFLKVSLDSHVKPQSFLSALIDCGSPTQDSFDDGVTISSFIKDYRGSAPLAIFPEGATRFDGEEVDLAIIGLKYTWDQSVCPCFTTGTKVAHLASLLYNWSHSLQARVLAPKDITLTEKTQPLNYNSSEGIVESQVSTMLAATLKVRKVAKTAEDKNKFLVFYAEREAKLARPARR